MRHLFFVVLLSSAPGAADGTFLLRKDASGYKPQVATSWTGTGSSVTFVLAPTADVSQVATVLRQRLPGVTITVAQQRLTIAGMPAASLLEQVAGLSLDPPQDAALDPLASLAQLEGAEIASVAPEGGGSIRASRPMGPIDEGPPATPPPQSECFAAVVRAVHRGAFPAVTLSLRVTQPAKAKTEGVRASRGSTVEAPVVIAGGGSAALGDLNAVGQTNLGAYYLQPGDGVRVHCALGLDERLRIDWIARTRGH